METLEKTVFEKILAGEIAVDKVYEDDEVLAFHDIDRQAPVHVLVIPKKKLVSPASFAQADLDHSWLGRFFSKVALVAQHLGVDQDGYRLVSNHGVNGGQSVAYLHVHILAGRQLGWPPG